MYDYLIKFQDKNTKFRKWKVKDKNKFMQAQGNQNMINDALIYDCLEDKDIALSKDELKYALLLIRDKSLNDEIVFDFICESCEEDYEYVADITDIANVQMKELKELEYNGVVFDMHRIPNREFFNEKIMNVNEQQYEFIYFVLSIKSINGNASLSFDEILEYINELDIDIFENILKQWNIMKFTLTLQKSVACPHCNSETLYDFDYFPGFFPESWDA